MDERTPTATALAGARSLLSSVDHMGRKRLDAEARLALVTEVVALGRQVEALRADGASNLPALPLQDIFKQWLSAWTPATQDPAQAKSGKAAQK